MEDEATRSELGLSLIKQLASCDNLVRDKALSQLINSWLPTQTQVPEDLMKKLWKGLFYCVWHADKSPAQSQLADKLSSSLLDLDIGVSIQFLSVFLVTIRREWSGIDVLRLDKFYLLIRRFLFNSFAFLKKNSWDLDLALRFVRVLEERVFFPDDKFQGNGVNYHIATVFLDEVTGFLPIQSEIVEVLFGLFISVMGKSPDKVLLAKIKSNVFDVLVKKGRDFIEVKNLDLGTSDDVGTLGSIALSMSFSSKFYEMGSSPDCIQGNRKMIFGLHEEFSKLEKDFASSGIEVSNPKIVESAKEEEEERVPELIPIEAEQGVVLKRCEKKNKKKKKKKKQNQNLENENVVEFDETAISNLQLQFEKIAAESGLDEKDIPSSCDSPNSSSTKATLSKKRKRVKSENGKKSREDENGAKSGGEKKKVKFSMKSNLVWKPQNPLPPQSLRLPPSATPRGSALKKGVPAGPIREVVGPTQQPKRAKAVRVVSVKKARKKVVKRLKKKSVSP